MTLHLYDTLTRDTHPVLPDDGETLRFYCCGPTVYGPAHIGNFRTFILQDVFRRVVEAAGLATCHVRNVTDVDDKTIRQSQAEGRTLSAFTAHWTTQFHADCAALNILPPHIEPRAVAHIPEQIALIEKLLEKGVAYQTEDDSVYFSVERFPTYGALSRLAERSITSTQADRERSDEYQRDSAADFALWKSRRPEDGENFWPSPFGEGRPGWHIECSAMSMKHLGEGFDLHSGGVDLIFPHHENEIAQSEAATGRRFVRHWFHVAHLLVDDRKMSKSLGNLYTLADLEKRGFSAEELRYVLFSGHYRQTLNFTLESLIAARSGLAKLRELQSRLGGPLDTLPPGKLDFGPFAPVLEALLDDLNTPEALGRLFSIAKTLSQGTLSDAERHAAQLGFAAVLRALGLRLPPPQEEAVPDSIAELAAARWTAKQNRDWKTADALRQQLTDAGWSVKDSAQSYELTPVQFLDLS